MRILFLFERDSLLRRAAPLINTLIGRGHRVSLWAPDIAVEEFDAWFFDLHAPHANEAGRPPSYADRLESYRGIPVCISLDDFPGMHEERLSPRMREKMPLYLGNMLFRNRDRYAAEIRSRLGLLYNFIEGNAYLQGPVRPKERRVFFAGLATGIPPRLGRIAMVRKMKASGLPFAGGLTGAPSEYSQEVLPLLTPDLLCRNLDVKEYLEIFATSLVNLCPRGNGCATYRFFEALAAETLVLSTPLDEIELLGAPEPGVHYATFAEDCSNLVDQCRFYLDHPEQAMTIAAAGRRLWEEYYRLENVDCPVLSARTSAMIMESLRHATGREW